MNDNKFSSEEVKKIAQTLTNELLMRFRCSSEDATERDGCLHFSCSSFNCSPQFNCSSGYTAIR